MVINRDKHNKFFTIGGSTGSQDTNDSQNQPSGDNNSNTGSSTGSTGGSTTIIYQGGGMTENQSNKLNGIEEGAEKNQDAFSYITIQGATSEEDVTLSADDPTDTFKLAAKDSITLSLEDDVITIGCHEAKYLKELLDVDAENPLDEDLLIYNSETEKWEAINPQFATIEWVNEQFDKIIGSAPEVLDTIYEIAEALGNDPDYVKDIANNLSALTNRVTITEQDITDIKSKLLPTNFTDLTSGQLLQYDGQYWVNVDKDAVGLNEEQLLEYLTAHNYAKKSDITWSNLIGKPSIYATNIANITDLNSGWDSLLANAPTAHITRWPNFSEIGSKPTTLVGYGITDGVNSITTSGTGNVITGATISGHVLTLSKGITAITSVSLATINDLHANWDAILKVAPTAHITRWPSWAEVTDKPDWIEGNKPSYSWSEITGKPSVFATNIANITDLHSSWDAVLKAQKPNWLTTVSLATITDLHANWDAILKVAPTSQVTRWPTWAEVTSKPSTLSGYGITDGVNAVSIIGNGNVITTASISGHTLTLSKGITALTSVSIATISDLHSSWDAALKAQKPAWLTSVSLATISDLHASWDALLKAAPSAYVTRWPTAAEVGALTQTSADARYLLKSAYTAADVLAKLKTVDGSGSGIDADLLDGYHGSSYLRSFWTSNPGYDANTYPTNSFCTFTYSRNAPYTGVLAYLGTNGYGMYLNLPYSTGTSTGRIAYRKVSPSDDGGGLGGWEYLARITDNVASATKLQTARTINGTSFDGTANITTAKWGTARTLTLTGAVTGSVSIDGSGNVSLTTTYSTGSSGPLDGRYALKGGSNATGTWPISISVKDIRDTAPTPNDKADKAVDFWFNNINKPGNSYWYSGMTVKGWSDGYVAWQLASDASSSITDSNLYFRSGIGTSWNTWKKVLDSTNYTNYTVTKTGGGASGTWNINITGNAATATNADTLDGRQGTSYGIMWGGMATNTDPGADDTTSTSITDFLTRLNYSGIFGSRFGAMRGSWYYVGNTQYNTGVGTLEMAGTAALNMSYYADTSANYKTLLFLEGSTGNMYSYVSQQSGTARWSRYAKTTDNVASATKLSTARQINGTNFDGTANITTAKWGTARNIYIRDASQAHTGTAVSVDGSANEYLLLPSTITATLSGNASTASKWATARTITLTGAVTGSVSIDGSGNVSLSTTYATGNISALDSRYVNISGDTMTGKLTLQRSATEEMLKLNNTNTTWGTLIRLYSSGTLKSTIGWSADHGSYIQGSSTNANPYACVRDDSLYWNDSSKFWHAGNDGSGSGLDADLLDGTHKTGLLTSVTSSLATNLSVTVGGTTKSVADLYATYLDGVTLAGLRGLGYAMQMTTINASSLNVDTWYPVTIDIGANHQVLIAVIVSLDSGTKPSWSTHQNGFSVRKVWYANGSGWGTNPVNRTVLFSDYSFTSTDPVRGLNQLTYSDNEYVYVRGGGKYYFYISHGKTPVLHTSTYTVNEQSVSPTTTAPAAIIRTNAMVTDNVASATKLQTARTINGTAFNGTSNIVTSYWGTARTLSLTGNATGSVSMNGSSNVSMSVNVNYASSAGNADTLDGVHNGSVTANHLYLAGGVSNFDTLTGNGLYSWGLNITGQPANYGSVLQFSNTNNPVPGTNQHWVTQLASSTSDRLYYRTRTNAGGWTAWHTLAFTTDNVASATQLRTARTIWGQSFNGTANVSGDMTGVGSISASGNITVTKSSASVTDVTVKNSLRSVTLRAATSGNVGVCEPNVDQWIVGTNGTNSFTMIGNFGIGTTSPSYKLHVAGTGYFSGALTTTSTITAAGYIYTNTGWFQNNTSGAGLYNKAVDARWYANANGWNADKKINAAFGLSVSAGASITGDLTMGASDQILRQGISTSWYNGRDGALIRTTTYPGYNAILSAKTTNGSWQLGTYSNDLFYFTYVTDANYNSGTNTATYNITLPKKSGTIALTSDIPSITDVVTGNAGSSTLGVYISNNEVKAMSYSLSAHVSTGITGHLAYYGGSTSLTSYSTSVGSSSKPIYINQGVPTACTDFHAITYYGKFYIDSREATYSTVAGNYNFIRSIVRSVEGQLMITVNLPGTVTALSQVFVWGVGIYTYIDPSTDGGCYISVRHMNTTQIRVTVHDDASANDGYFYLCFLAIG